MAGFSNENKPISKFVSKIEDNAFVLLNAVGPLGFAIFLTFVPDWWKANSAGTLSSFIEVISYIWFLLWNPITGSIVFLGLTTIGAIGQARDSKSLKKSIEAKDKDLATASLDLQALADSKKGIENRLRTEVENNYQLAEELINSYKKMAHLWICQIFNELELDVKHRISIYYLDNNKENMVLLDRFAKNYEYNTQGRPHFKRTQGVMGKVWAEGEFFEVEIPEFTRKNTHYYKYLEQNYDFSRDVSSRLRMKSRTIGGFAIEDAQGHHIGVIIFESLDINGFEQNKLRETVKRENHRLVEFITDTAERDLRPMAELYSQQEGGNEPKAA